MADDRPPPLAPPIDLWTLPEPAGERLRVLAGRALVRRCPYCGGKGIFAGYFALKEACPTCGVRFEREEGYFLGGYALNLIVAEILGLALAVYLIFGTGLRNAPLIWQEAVAVGLAVAFPILFFPYSRTAWMALDLLLNPPGKHPERYLRGRQMGPPGGAGG